MRPGIVLGIDTGGTFTDAAIVDVRSRKVICSAKVPTARGRLIESIAEVVERVGLKPEEVSAVVISTTLATNAVVEGQTRPVGLALIGYDEELLREFELDRNVFGAVIGHFPGGADPYGVERPGFDENAVADWAESHWPAVEAFAVSSYFGPRNLRCEESAAQAIASRLGATTVVAGRLTSRLGSVERATTASLDASLLPIAVEFMDAVQRTLGAISEKMLFCSRSDGTLMPIRSARTHPIETVASGPAAAARGACFLAGCDTGIVVDVGGTTADITLVRDGVPETCAEGAVIGGFPTAVPSIRVSTIGMGGDCVIGPGSPAGPVRSRLVIRPRRVTPLAKLAAMQREVVDQLRAASKDSNATPETALDYWYLTDYDARLDLSGVSSEEEALIAALKSGPATTPVLLERMDLVHERFLPWNRLVRLGAVDRAGFTLTDALHLTGELSIWGNEAPSLAARVLGRSTGVDEEDIPETALQAATRRLACALVDYVANGESASQLVSAVLDGEIERVWPLVPGLKIGVPVVMVGGMAPALAGRLPRLLGAECIVPRFHAVAGAVGAATGRWSTRCEASVYPSGPEYGFAMAIGSRRELYAEVDDALAAARSAASEAVREKAASEGFNRGEVDLQTLEEGSSFRVLATLGVEVGYLTCQIGGGEASCTRDSS